MGNSCWNYDRFISICYTLRHVQRLVTNQCRRQPCGQEQEIETNETECSPSPVTRTVEHRNSIRSEVSGTFTDTRTFQNYAFQSTDNL